MLLFEFINKIIATLEQKRSYSGCPGVSDCNTVPASSRRPGMF